eukprot:CAMPEP_0204320438 /NCGR_PEP_ID=MMETSP0469-20131031/7644_1 /ASSEMBLY_ACC=CAM_ASM_000384 /TAXON_ID=2969 /ORGANISM="Oxyrrhis marina" /LENGTH=229 /DNA_ID=CAMNT_0051301703 /DNA_START=46 /DNA_END=732 /DNA_ORIENTATION=-
MIHSGEERLLIHPLYGPPAPGDHPDQPRDSHHPHRRRQPGPHFSHHGLVRGGAPCEARRAARPGLQLADLSQALAAQAARQLVRGVRVVKLVAPAHRCAYRPVHRGVAGTTRGPAGPQVIRHAAAAQAPVREVPLLTDALVVRGAVNGVATPNAAGKQAGAAGVTGEGACVLVGHTSIAVTVLTLTAFAIPLLAEICGRQGGDHAGSCDAHDKSRDKESFRFWKLANLL